MSFTVKQLRYFIAVAQTGGVSSAAIEVSISQSSITSAIQDLEDDLGITLFERHYRGLNLTQHGYQFLRYAEELVARVDEAKNIFSVKNTQVEGVINVGITPLVAGYVISDILTKYRQRMPKVVVRLREDNGEYLEHLLVGCELDVAVMVISNLHNKIALISEALEVSPYQLWLPANHPLAEKESIEVEDIYTEPLIMLRTDETEKATQNLLSQFGIKPQTVLRTSSVEAVRSLVATGCGVALVPKMLYRPWSLEGDRIIARTLSGYLPITEVGTVWRRGSEPNHLTRQFLSCAHELDLKR